MPYTSIFLNNRTQAVRIFAHMCFDDAKQVVVRQVDVSGFYRPSIGCGTAFLWVKKRILILCQNVLPPQAVSI